MVVVMAPEATQADVDAVVQLVQAAGGEAFVSSGVSRTIIGLVGDIEQFGALDARTPTMLAGEYLDAKSGQLMSKGVTAAP